MADKCYKITLFLEGEIEIEVQAKDRERAYRKALGRVKRASSPMRVGAPKWVGVAEGQYKAEEIAHD